MKLKKNNVFDTTTDNRTYNICSFKQSGECCIHCRNRQRRTYYHIYEYDDKVVTKYPNWKMVSKNKKQWMKKTLLFKTTYNRWRKDYKYTTIKW